MYQNYYKKYSLYLILSIILTTVGVFIGGLDIFKGMANSFVSIFLSLMLLILFLFSTGEIKKILFYLFCLGEGIILTPFIEYYTGVPIFGCLLLVSIVVTILMIVGYKSENLSFMGGTLLVGLVGGFGYSILRLFLYLPSISILMVILFGGYVAYDFNMFKQKVNEGVNLSDDDILIEVMNMYLNILNIFIYLLSIFGKSDD